jgi:hypothetical protein
MRLVHTPQTLASASANAVHCLIILILTSRRSTMALRAPLRATLIPHP